MSGGKAMTFVSLFAGIGGFDLGLERAGMKCIAQVEIDPYCRAVLAKHWPDVPRFEDVREVGAHNLPAADLICGGFPCQDISNAGKRAGINGERSGLWSEYARIIREVRPRYVVVENVAALLQRGLGRVLGDLAEIGYIAEWDCLPAASVGAFHIRDRLFIVGLDSDAAGDIQHSIRSVRVQRNSQPNANGRRSVFGQVDSHANRLRLQGFRGDQDGAWATEQFARLVQSEIELSVPAGSRGRVSDGVSNRMDRLRGLGNAVVPQVAEVIGRAILAAHQEAA